MSPTGGTPLPAIPVPGTPASPVPGTPAGPAAPAASAVPSNPALSAPAPRGTNQVDDDAQAIDSPAFAAKDQERHT